MFRPNVGGIDRVLRVTLGVILTVAGLILMARKASFGMTVVVVGVIVLLTGVVRFCGLYIPFGISTARPGGQTRRAMQACCGGSMEQMRDERCAGKSVVSPENEVATTSGQQR